MNQKPIEKLTLTEIAAEIAERLRVFDATGGAERMGPWVRVYSRDEDARDPGNVEIKLVRADASKYLELLRRGYQGPKRDVAQTVYRVQYGRMLEVPGYACMFGARNPEASYETWHLTRLEAAQEYLTEQTKRLREVQESQAEALALWQRERKAAEDAKSVDGSDAMAVDRSAEGEDSHGRRWLAVLYVNGYHELLPVGHSGDPATLSNADYDRLLDPVLPRDEDESDDGDPYLAELDRCFDRWKDSRVAA